MKNKYTLFVIFLIILIYWKWLLPFEHVSTDLHRLSLIEGLDRLRIPQQWTDAGALGLGQYDGFTNWNWPIRAVTGLLMRFGATSNMTHQFFLFTGVIGVGFYSMYSLLKHLNISKKTAVSVTFFYLVNTYTLLVIDGGQLLIALSYSLLPLCYLLILQAIERLTPINITKAALSISVLGFFDIRFVLILGILLILNALWKLIYLRDIGYVKQWIKVGALSSSIFLLLHLFWILPFTMNPSSSFATEVMSVTQLDFLNFTSLAHALLAQQPHWPLNNFGNISSPNLVFILIPLFSFLAIKNKKHTKNILFWILIALLSLFLVKGINPPFGKVYYYLFEYVPGFSVFRDSTKFFFLLNLSFSVLIGFSLDYLKGKLNNNLFSYFFIVYILVIFLPTSSLTLQGTFLVKPDQSAFEEIEQILRSDEEFSRTLWIPYKNGLSYTSITKPGLEALRIYNQRPFNTGSIGKYDSLNFIRDADYMGEIFDVYGIGYISYPDMGYSKQEDADYYHTFLKQIEHLDWVDRKLDIEIPTFKTKRNKEKIFLASNTYAISGSDRIYEQFHSGSNRLSDNALIFLDEHTGFTSIERDIPLIYDNELDAIVTISKKKTVPANQVIQITQDFWRGYDGLIIWRDFLEQKYGLTTQDFYPEGIIVAEGKKTTEIDLEQEGKLFVRLLKTPLSEAVVFEQKENRVIIDTKLDKKIVKRTIHGYDTIEDQVFDYLDANFYWVEIENIDPSFAFEVTTEGAINAFNQFAILRDEDFFAATDVFNQKEKYKSADLKFGQSEVNDVELEYQRLSPTEYIVTISNLKKPLSMVFSQTYDNNWKLYRNDNTSTSPYPVYSGLNGYWITQNGTYRLYYEPQKLIQLPFTISSISFIIVILYIMKYVYTTHKNKRSS